MTDLHWMTAAAAAKAIAAKELSPVEAIERLSEYTPRLKADISDMAMRLNINIIAGSHPTMMDDGETRALAPQATIKLARTKRSRA